MPRARRSNILSMFEKCYDADIPTIARLATTAVGDRSVSEFAKLCGVSTSTMTRLLSGNNSTASSDELIVAIAIHTVPQVGVTFRKLVNAQGYRFADESDWSEEEKVENYIRTFLSVQADYLSGRNAPVSLNTSAKEDAVRRIVQCELIDRGYSVKMGGIQDHVFFDISSSYAPDFVLQTNALEGETLDKWAFEVKAFAGATTAIAWFRRIFGLAYVTQPASKGYRMTLAVCDWDAYSTIKTELDFFDDKPIADSISLMLVDLTEGKILAEHVMLRQDDTKVVRFFDDGAEKVMQMRRDTIAEDNFYSYDEEDDE